MRCGYAWSGARWSYRNEYEYVLYCCLFHKFNPGLWLFQCDFSRR